MRQLAAEKKPTNGKTASNIKAVQEKKYSPETDYVGYQYHPPEGYADLAERLSHSANRASGIQLFTQLQRSYGNRYVQRMIQAQMKVNQPGDIYEKEADRVAEQVTQATGQIIQRKPGENSIQTKPLPLQITPLIQKKEDKDEEEKRKREEEKRKKKEEEERQLQKKENGIGINTDVNQDITSHIEAMKGSGQPLPVPVRSLMEQRFGYDFNQVRIHDSTRAMAATQGIGARAFTVGPDIAFASGQYALGTNEGRKLLSHELTHVIQQGYAPRLSNRLSSPGISQPGGRTTNTIQRQPLAPATSLPEIPATTKETGTSTKSAIEAVLGTVDIKDNPDLTLIADKMESMELSKGTLDVRFGKMAKGRVNVEKSKDSIRIKEQALSFSHPLFPSELKSIEPGMIISTRNGAISGYIGTTAGDKINKIIEDYPEIMGLSGLGLSKLPTMVNNIESGQLHLGMKNASISVGNAFNGSLDLEAIDENITFKGSADIQVMGLAGGKLELNRSKEGLITGRAAVELNLSKKNFSGGVDVAWDGEAVTGEGKVGYQGEKLSGTVILRLTEKSEALQTGAETKKSIGETPAKGKASSKKKSGKTDYAISGEGDLSFSFTDWLSGTAHVTVNPKGAVTIVGEITPQAEIELFPQRDYNKHLFKFEARARYGIPVVGNIFIFGNISMDAFAKLGPAKFYKIVAKGTYSTDPGVCKDFSVQGSLNISAAAGLKMRGEAGAGIEILAHDIKAGAGLNGLAGIRGYAEATPVIGYREKQAEKGEDKKGEFFIQGDLEIAAQPFLGLSGDLFVEVDAPWWSPCPDKKWTWPLFGKEWPIGGSFGLNAHVAYVFGSDQYPQIEFKPVEFSADKFLTDMYSDKAKSKSGGDKENKGTWNEKNSKSAGVPSGPAKKTSVKEGPSPELPPAKAKVTPGGPKKAKGDVDPGAVTREGKTVGQYQKEATAKGKKPDSKEPAKGSAKEEKAAKEEVPTNDVKAKVLVELNKLVNKKLDGPEQLDREIDEIYKRYKKQGLKHIRVDVKGDTFSSNVEIKVIASAPESILVGINTLFPGLSEKQKKQLLKATEEGRKTNAVLYLDDKQLAATSSGGGKGGSNANHAEMKLINKNEWKEAQGIAIKRVAKTDKEGKLTQPVKQVDEPQETDIKVGINRSPCKDCAKSLSKNLHDFWNKFGSFARKAKEKITYILSMLGQYTKSRDTTQQDFNNLKEANWNLKVHTVSEEDKKPTKYAKGKGEPALMENALGQELIDNIEKTSV